MTFYNASNGYNRLVDIFDTLDKNNIRSLLGCFKIQIAYRMTALPACASIQTCDMYFSQFLQMANATVPVLQYCLHLHIQVAVFVSRHDVYCSLRQVVCRNSSSIVVHFCHVLAISRWVKVHVARFVEEIGAVGNGLKVPVQNVVRRCENILSCIYTYSLSHKRYFNVFIKYFLQYICDHTQNTEIWNC